MSGLKRILVRTVGNFMTTFSFTLLSVQTTTSIPPAKLIVTALFTGLLIAAVSTGYQLQKWSESNGRR